jgi:hypothetical protein
MNHILVNLFPFDYFLNFLSHNYKNKNLIVFGSYTSKFQSLAKKLKETTNKKINFSV